MFFFYFFLFLPLNCTLTSALANLRLFIQKSRKINHLSTQTKTIPAVTVLRKRRDWIVSPTKTVWISAFVKLQHWRGGLEAAAGECGRHFLFSLPAVSSFREVSGHLALEDVWRLRLHLCCEQRVDIRPNPIRLCAGKWVQDSLWPERRRGNKKIMLEISMQIWDNLFTYYSL